ncbi:MAG: hypothetical protein E6G57_14660 [Actinobacteria bacterium]|nr:MAG: hypothetical protein E6G57_14660 [Actinomycetota bacterium]
MMDPRLEDHAVGLELQIVELEERCQRALVQGRADDADRLESEAETLRTELASTAELLSS